MILYNLRCQRDHVFETWFRDSATYDTQVEGGDIQCPVCGSRKVQKAIMAPRIAKSGGRQRVDAEPAPEATPESEPTETKAVTTPGVTGATAKAAREVEQSAKLRRALLDLRRQIEQNCDYVGPRFAEEARKIHYREAEQRSIYGESSEDEERALQEEGIEVRRIPWLPRENS